MGAYVDDLDARFHTSIHKITYTKYKNIVA